ncbi:hypothetical protein K440DRAFT_583026, partial [Wilcoxina mikolae CBS 423.85]
GNQLTKRACDHNGCECLPGFSSGLYCYGCGIIKNHGKLGGSLGSDYENWVFQCEPSGYCCSYGTRKSCRGGAADPCQW